jgi:multiple sugar transport system substrate-binding protein
MKSSRKAITALVVTAALGLSLGACSNTKDGGGATLSPTNDQSIVPDSTATGTPDGSAPSSGTPSDTTSGAPGASGTPLTIDWWGWAPGYQAAADAFNAAHSDVQVHFEQISPGSQGGYDKLLTSVQAGNAPCLGQVGYETFTSFVAAGALEDVTQAVASAQDQFPEWVWNQVSVEGQTFGVPVDIGTMGLFYRTDVFQEHNIDVPKTWTEYREAAEKLKAADSSIKIASLPTDAYNYSGFAWQAGARWFDAQNNSWTVNIDSEANQKVAEYWQGMVDDGLVATYPSWDAALYSAWASGEVVTEVGAVWTSALLKDNAGESAGKWAVAPMPVWEGSDAVGNVGGGSNAVMKGCANPQAAVDAAVWLATAPEAVSAIVTEGGMYPASKDGANNPDLARGDEFFGGQSIFDVFRSESAKVNTDWQWGPVMPVTSAALADGLGAVGAGTGTVQDALAAAQTKTVDEIKAQGFAISGE